MKEITLKSNEIKVLKVNIADKSYNIPLAKSLSLKEARAMKDDEDGLAFFAKYIPMKVLESLTVEDIANLANAWRDASFVKDEVTMGE
jgi:predicted RNase H-like nuclease (RuvC/YqgF family)